MEFLKKIKKAFTNQPYNGNNNQNYNQNHYYNYNQINNYNHNNFNSNAVIPKASVDEDIAFPDWNISISFGKSSSNNYAKAVVLAKAAPQYHEQTDDGKILHQAIYSSKPNEYLAFVMLYELVGSWKSSFVMINSKLIDRKIVGNLNYCYGDKCRSVNKDFCHGASYMSENPFGCHRLQINAANNPLWSYYHSEGYRWILDRASLKARIESYAKIYCVCPVFNYTNIMKVYESLPDVLSEYQLKNLIRANTTL